MGTNLWAEVKQGYRRARVPLGGRMYDGTEFVLAKDTHYMLGFSTKEPEMVHGIHGPHDLLILDDAHGVPKTITDEVENMMAGGQTRVLMLFNPIALSGETYDCTHAQAHLYRNIKIGFTDLPPDIPGLLQSSTAAEWVKRYGPDSNFCRVKVYGDYPRQEADTLIPLDWVEAAFSREVPRGAATVVAVDVARFGDDRTVILAMTGRRVHGYEIETKQDTMAIVGRATATADVYATKQLVVDGVGLGAGVVDRARELPAGYGVTDFVAGAKAINEEQFADARSEAWWALREALNPVNPAAIALPADAALQAEVTSVKYQIMSDKRIRVESKQDMKKRLGYSPDIADALVMACWAMAPGGRPASGQSPYSSLMAQLGIARPAWAS